MLGDQADAIKGHFIPFYDLRKATDPIGPDNDLWLICLAEQSATVVGAWGNRDTFMNRGQEVAARFPHMRCLGLTKRCQPRHPLYVPAGASLAPFGSNIRTSATVGWLSPHCRAHVVAPLVRLPQAHPRDDKDSLP